MANNNLFDFKNKDKLEILPQHRCDSQKFSKVNFVLFSVIFILIISSLILSVFSIYKAKKVQEEVDYLLSDIDQLRSSILNSDLLNDIRKFENEETYSDNLDKYGTKKWLVNEEDDVDTDYDLSYDEEHNFSSIPIGEYTDSSRDHEDSSDLIKGGNLTKVGKETNRFKRNIGVTTIENIPINSESYATMKKKNISTARRHKKNMRIRSTTVSSNNNGKAVSSIETTHLGSPVETLHGLKHYSDLQNENVLSTTPPIVLSRRSRVYHPDDKLKVYGRVVRKPRLKSNNHWETIDGDSTVPETTIIREDHPEHRRKNRHRLKNNLETFDEKPRGRMRLMPAIQFSGDTSKYVVGQHTNFNGNGHLRHPNPTYVDWIANEWVKSINMDQYFQMDDGNLKIKETGLYLVYSQIFYLDEHDTNGYRVYKNKEIILQCTTMTHSVERVIKGNTCYTAGLELLNEGDILSVQDLGTGRYSIFEPGKSFFGAIKMADVKAK